MHTIILMAFFNIFSESLKGKKDVTTSQATKLVELENTYKDTLDESKKIKLKIKNLEDKLLKQDSVVCFNSFFN